MSRWKIVARIAAVAAFLVLASVPAQASGCCEKDCDDAYGTMLNSGVNARDAAEWYRGCITACKEHGDPTTCPLMQAASADDSIEAKPAVEPEVLPAAPASEFDPVVFPRVVTPIPLR